MTDPRQNVAGVRFRNAGPIEYFHAAGMRLEVGESVIVETNRGPELARVVIAPDQVVVNELGEDNLHPILRLATEDDLVHASDLAARAEELLPEARAIAEEAGLEGRVDRAEFTLDGERLTFLVSGEGTGGQREFSRRAGRRWDVRATVRRIGARDRARLAGGYGICGRELCCSNWLATFPSVSIRLAKDQELPLNPEKISGLCGRLLCCLSYEEEGYKEMKKTLPRMGQRCSTPTGEGKVVGINVLRRQVTLNVGGQRIEVGERDLGLVVRWDPSARNAEPPPSITREEAIAQGLIEPEEEPEPELEVVAAMPEAAPIELGRESREAPPRERPRGRGRGRGRRGGGNRQSSPQPQQQSGDAPRGRVFRRSSGNRPAGEGPRDGPPSCLL
ncbi:MAG: hypothetical protein F4X89_14395 [Dehalococcoidia bacterium]|nr:hypothetical protein [Dehalococcoidia bacterium]